MDTLSELFDQFKKRLSNPLTFSFLVSWVAFNWEIPVALFWHNGSTPGVPKGLIQYIDGMLTFCRSLLYPLLVALLYTGIVKNLVSALNAWATTWGGNWNLSISKDAKVPMSKYLKMRSTYELRNKGLEEVITSESTIQDQVLNLQTELQTVRAELVDKNTELLNARDQFSKLTNPSILSGRWKKTRLPKSGEVVENIEVNNSNLVFVHDGVTSYQKYQINDFIYAQGYNRMEFTLIIFKESRVDGYAFNVLEFKYNDWVGWEYYNNERYEVRYVRDK